MKNSKTLDFPKPFEPIEPIELLKPLNQRSEINP